MNLTTANLFAFIADQTKLSGKTVYDLYRAQTKPYNIYRIRQGKRSKLRTIEEPSPELKQIQKVLVPLFERFPLHRACTSIKGSSAALNAERHRGAKYLLKTDIKECYHNIEITALLQSLQCLPDRNQKEMLELCLTFCIYRDRPDWYRLPTGAPTSPILCNIALTQLDYNVSKYLEDNYPDQYTYTRYLDDLIISTKQETRAWSIKDHIELFIRGEGLEPNPKKCKWLTTNGSDQTLVTGVRVGNNHGIPRSFHRNVRARLQNIAKAGQSIDPETQGCLAYIKSVDSNRYDSLLQYFEKRKNYVSSQ